MHKRRGRRHSDSSNTPWHADRVRVRRRRANYPTHRYRHYHEPPSKYHHHGQEEETCDTQQCMKRGALAKFFGCSLTPPPAPPPPACPGNAILATRWLGRQHVPRDWDGRHNDKDRTSRVDDDEEGDAWHGSSSELAQLLSSQCG